MSLHHRLLSLILAIVMSFHTTYGRPNIPIDDPRCKELILHLWNQHPHNNTLFSPRGDYPGQLKPMLQTVIDVCGPKPSIYPRDDIYSRIASWCVPLFILVGTYQFPALGVWNAISVAVHLLTDPFTTMFCLLTKLADDRTRYKECRSRLNLSDQECRAVAMLLSASEELGQCVRATCLGSCTCDMKSNGSCGCISLSDPNPIGDSTYALTQLLTYSGEIPESVTDDYRKACIDFAKELTYSRASGIWKTSLGTLNYVAAVILAFLHTIKEDIKNRTGHSIAFAMLYTWLIPIVLLSAVVGEFVTKRSVRTVLTRLQERFDIIAREAGQSQSTVEVFRFDRVSESELEGLLIWCGGNYAFRPNQRCWSRERVILGITAVFPVLIATLCAVLISFTSPTRGIGCRSMLQLLFFAAWVASALLTHLLTGRISGPMLWRWVRAKDLVIFLPQCIVYLAAFCGLFNSPFCWSSWFSLGSQAYILLEMTSEIKALARFTWPMMAGFVLGAQLVLVTVILKVYKNGRLYGRLDEDLGEQR